MAAVISATHQQAIDAKSGAKAGAKLRRREAEEATNALEAAIAADKSSTPTKWTYQYRADGELRTATVWERGRSNVSGHELLSMCREAARLAAGRLKARHGIPSLSEDERDELCAELACRLIGDDGRPPARELLTRSYLCKRAEGIVLDDPDRQRQDAGADGGDVVAMAAAAVQDAETTARKVGRDGADPMLNPGTGTEPESLTVAADCVGLTPKARRAASYLMGGGVVRGDWSEAWQTTPGYAATRIVPEGAEYLRQLDPERAASFKDALLEASQPDELDQEARAMLARERGERGSVIRHRSLKPWRDRIGPGDRIGSIGPVVPERVPAVRSNKSIIVRSKRTRARRAVVGGWEAPSR